MSENNACFVDTNVWLYALIEGQDKNKTKMARTLILETESVVSTQIINEVCVNLLKKTDIPESRIGGLIESFYAKYPVVEIDKPILLASSQLRQKYSFSYWDSLVVACALSAGVGILYTEDIQGGMVVESKLKIINPFAR
jgi:predicted nucleic acid-binding protein